MCNPNTQAMYRHRKDKLKKLQSLVKRIHKVAKQRIAQYLKLSINYIPHQ